MIDGDTNSLHRDIDCQLPCRQAQSRPADRRVLASDLGMDLLVTWNGRHIDNPAMKPLVRSVCALAGYPCPEICTPLEILEAAHDEE